ncbi:hypothetical protein PTKIN_Ptkin15bG0181000 [Pterospermum kingtungense]
MSNNSLYECLHGIGHDPLTWTQRLEICIGAARGLHYLHTGAKRAVIHHNINSPNILLDDQRVPKLCDFGLSKLGPSSMSKAPLRIELPLSDEHMSTRMVCGLGYLDPEFVTNTTLVTDKSDVYSFGVVLLEVLCGRKVKNFDADDDEKHLIPWVSKYIKNGKVYQTIDPNLKGKIAPSCLEKFLEIALSCIKLQGDKRPAIGEVKATLELALELQNKADSEMECINREVHAAIESSPSTIKYSLCSPIGFLEVLKKKSHHQTQSSGLPGDICRQFSLAEIKAATNNFHQDSMIGENAYGSVYQGTIDDETMVTVKRCQSRSLRAKELRNEALLLSQLRHPNLVSLIGICIEKC